MSPERKLAQQIVDDASRRMACGKPIYDSVDLGEALVRQAIAAAYEDCARIARKEYETRYKFGEGYLRAGDKERSGECMAAAVTAKNIEKLIRARNPEAG